MSSRCATRRAFYRIANKVRTKRPYDVSSSSHGDVSIPILAPGSVEECFSAGALAVSWAERYQGPVIVMSEFGQAEKGENIKQPDLSAVNVEQRSVYTVATATQGMSLGVKTVVADADTGRSRSIRGQRLGA